MSGSLMECHIGLEGKYMPSRTLQNFNLNLVSSEQFISRPPGKPMIELDLYELQLIFQASVSSSLKSNASTLICLDCAVVFLYFYSVLESIKCKKKIISISEFQKDTCHI